uniref:Defensin-like cystein-rich peptide n=1 Tax=Torenia fournieri TaxID=68875 RepID=B9ZZY9_9LAMI|nr:defensin-like cystein-rich peptide [Torenia fournieri]
MRVGFSGLITLILLFILPLASASWSPLAKPGSYRLENSFQDCMYYFYYQEEGVIHDCDLSCKSKHGENAIGHCDFKIWRPYWPGESRECQCWRK